MWDKLKEFLQSECDKVEGKMTEFFVSGGKKASGVVEVGTRMVSIEVLENFVYDCLIVEESTEEVLFAKTRELADFGELKKAIESDLASAAKGKMGQT